MPSVAYERRDHAQELLDDQRRQAFQRLVEKQKTRIEHQRAADGEHLLLAAGELRAEIAATLAQTREQLEHARRGPRPGPGYRGEIFLDRERLPDVALLRHPAQAGGCALVRAQGRDGATVELDAAAAIARHADQRREQRGLAGAVAPEQRERLALVERKVDAVDDHALAVARAQAANAKKLRHASASPRYAAFTRGSRAISSAGPSATDASRRPARICATRIGTPGPCRAR